MTTAFQIFQLPKGVPLNAGVIMPGAKASFFITETSTPSPVYTDPELQVAHTQPVVADAAGILPTIYLDPAITYKVTLTTAADALYYTIDPANDQVLSQAAIGQLLYPRTPAEIAAGVTPTNYYRPPGHIERYGADPTGVADSYQAFVDAFASNSLIFGEQNGLYKNATQSIVVTGNKSFIGCLGSIGGNSFRPVTLNHDPACVGPFFQNTSAEFGATYFGQFDVIGGNGGEFIVSTRPQSVFEGIHLEGSTGYDGSGIGLTKNGTNADQGSWQTIIRHCKWVGPAAANAYRGFSIDIYGGEVLIEDCTAIRGSVGIEVFAVEALTIRNSLCNRQDSSSSSEAATAGQCGIRLSNSLDRKSVLIEGCYLEGATTQIWSDACRSLTIQSNFIDDLGSGGSRDIYLANSSTGCARIIGNDIRTRSGGKHAIENNGFAATVESNTINAEGGSGAAWLKTTTEVTYGNNNILAGVLDDASNLAINLVPTSGSFTGTLTGCTTSPTGSITWQLSGRIVCMQFPSISGTSNTTACTITGVPAALIPATVKRPICRALDNGAAGFSVANVDPAVPGTVTLGFGPTNGAFTNPGVKGISSCCITYSLD